MRYLHMTSEETLSALNVSRSGLSSNEAAQRRQKFGPNVVESVSGPNPFAIFIDQFKSFIIYILLFAVIFSLLIGEYVDSVIILAILLANALIGFFQELSAHRALEALKRMTDIQAQVLRDGELTTLPSRALVPGDLIYLNEGDRAPADARIIETVRLMVEESALTGESLPVEKQTDPISPKAALGDQSNMLFATTSIVKGHARAVVTATGLNSEIGRITQLVQEAKTEMTPLQRRLDRFGRKLGVAVIAICLLVFLMALGKEMMTGQVSAASFIGFAFIAISLAVAAVPTALPAVVTIALSIGVKRLLKKQSLVRTLASVETLGSCNVICTDKTGTLTQNAMTVRQAWTLTGEVKLGGEGYAPKGEVSGHTIPLLFEIGALCNNAKLFQDPDSDIWTIRGDPTEAALITSAYKTGLSPRANREDELPFDSDRKRMSVMVRMGDTRRILVKGAPDQVLEKCERVWIDGAIEPLTEGLRHRIIKQNDHYAAQAMRVLGFAFRDVGSETPLEEQKLVFVGLQAMIDPPRAEVPDALAACRKAGIRVIMITGDYQETARAVGREIGIQGGLVSGPQLEAMEDAELEQLLKGDVNLFSRVAPEHKQRIVKALQRLEYTVAMTGDGVNDAPALKKADIGVAVGSGSEVAKEASDFVLLDDSFAHIVNAIEEGRGIYDNIQKSIMLLLSGNLGEVLIIFLAVMLGLNLPLTAILLLWINMVTDGAPALAYCVDPYSKKIMERSPKPRDEGILPPQRMALIGVLGVVGSLIALTIFALTGGQSDQPEMLMKAQTLVFNYVVLYELILVFIIRLDYQVPLLKNGWIWASVILSVLLQALLMYTPLSTVFHIVPLNLIELAILGLGGTLFFTLFLVYHFWVEPLLFRVDGAKKPPRRGSGLHKRPMVGHV
ncbi:MAG: cation-translocating P-type ATPase [Magnetococcales bacterium]|nr:cation-translocating P-type ATPase [Magnetococcales bacterium]